MKASKRFAARGATLAVGSGLVALFAGGAGAVPGAMTVVQVLIDGTGGVDGIDGAGGVTVSPDDAHVYVAGFSEDAVAAFARDPSTGQLTFLEVERDGVGGVDGLDGVARLAISPDGAHLYTVSEIDNAVTVFTRDPTTGRLTFVEVTKDGDGGADGLDGAYGVAVSPDGSHIYTAAFNDNAVSVFGRDPASGKLTFVEMEQDGVGGVDSLDFTATVALSPDGRYLYADGNADDAVTVFSRDPLTGALTFVEAQRDGVGGVDGIAGSFGLTVSGDGRHLYVTSDGDDAVAAFARDAQTGRLTFVEAERDGVAGVDGLGGATFVAASPVGAHVYTGSSGDRAVVAFSRDPVTGGLTFVEQERDGTGGVESLSNVGGVAVSGDGRWLYTVAFNDDAVTVFSIEPIRCRGQAATIVGGPSDDVLTGTPGRDVIAGLDGRDRANASGGRDLVCGGRGNDTLRGGAGRDALLGQGGRDRLVGGSGRGDLCRGGPGRDRNAASCERGRP